jgi:cobalt-zinc-cadmium efflux system outer membrane protein
MIQLKRLNNTLIVWLLSILSVSLSAQTTLDTYLQTAAENNPGLQAKFSEYYAALEKVPQSGSLPDPEAFFGYYILPVETRLGAKSFDLSLSQSFPWFGMLAARKDEASQRAAARYQAFLTEKNELFYQVKTIYYRLWFTDQSINTYNEYLLILDLQERSTINEVGAAKSSLSDVLRIQMERTEIIAQIEWLKDERKTHEAKMNRFLGQALESPVAVNYSMKIQTLNTNKNSVLDSVMANNPKITNLQEQKLAWEKQKKIARKNGMPTFGVGLSYAAISPRTDIDIAKNGQDMLMPMTRIRIPLYRNKYKAMLKEADYRIQGIQQELADTKNTLAADLVMASNQYRDAQRRVKLYTELLKQAQETLEILTISYMAAMEDYEEVLRMQQQLLKYRLELEHARSRQNTAVALLEKLMATGIE